MRRWLTSDAAMLAWRLLLAYTALMLCRIAFLTLNADAIGPIGWTEGWTLFRGALAFDTASVIWANALFIVMSLLPFRFRSRRWYRRTMFGYYIAANTLAAAINLSDAVYFHYTAKRFTADEIFFARNDNTFTLLLKFAVENWYLVLLLGALAAMLVLLYGRRIVPRTPIENPWGYYIFNTLLLAAAAALSVGGVRGGFSRMTRPITLSNATRYASTPAKANLVLSNPFCIIRTVGTAKSIDIPRFFSDEELAAIYTPCHFPVPRHIDEPKNIMIFVLESFSAEHSAFLNPDLYGNEPGYTPFLDSLMRGGHTFTRAYANGSKSIEALPAVFGSIPSLRTPFVLMPQALGKSRQLPRILADRDYPTLFFCGSEAGSMGFEAYMRSAGVETFHSRGDYEAARGKRDFDGYWGIWDMPFMDYMGEVLGTVAQPFMAGLFTLSSHHPFVVPDGYEYLPEGKTRIHRGVQYTDLSVRRFFEKYGDEDWFRRTVFVFVADHVSSETYAAKTRTAAGRNHIIQFIYTPDGSLRGIDGRVTQQIDLMPTLMNLVPDAEPFFAFGRDTFADDGRIPVAFRYSQGYVAVTDSVVVISDGDRISGVFAASDTALEHDLSDNGDADIEAVETLLKAFLQQYYTRISRMDYTCP